MIETREVYAFICRGIAGAPSDVLGLYVTADQNDVPRPLSEWKPQAYWALSTSGENCEAYFQGAKED